MPIKNDSGKKIKRKQYTTHLDQELLRKFKIYCAENEVNQYEVIESLMRNLLNNEDPEYFIQKEILQNDISDNDRKKVFELIDKITYILKKQNKK